MSKRNPSRAAGDEPMPETSAAAAAEPATLVPAADSLPARPEESQRESRRLLSAAVAIPSFLTERWPLIDGYAINHTTWKDNALPHFQGRLGPGAKLDNKTLVSNGIQ